MKRLIRQLWEITSWPERVVTVMTPVMPFLAFFAGYRSEAVVWVVAGFWWVLYLTAKVDADDVRHELWLSRLIHQVFVATIRRAEQKRRHQAETRSSVRFPRGHRR